MCINPSVLRDGTQVFCRKCWQCTENRINDWVGRCVAEQRTASASHSVTLTYGGGDHERAAVLTYSDVQKFLKRLRFHGFPCRYFVAGEYGTVKGRAHWHMMLYWQGKVPPHVEGERFQFEHWEHGYAFFEQPNPASVRYVCKYIQKDFSKAQQQGLLRMSKRPPLGAQYFDELAARYVEQGLAPQTPRYQFADVRDKHDKPIQFYLSGASLDYFCASFLERWARSRGGHPPSSELLQAYEDRVAPKRLDLAPEPFRPRLAAPWLDPPGGGLVRFSESHNAHYSVGHDGLLWWWSYDDEGNRSWQRKIETETSATRSKSPLAPSSGSSGAYLDAKHGGRLKPSTRH